jgi:3-methyladenine DNA glycosylase/8-oxoguanine DNA glycosylase
MSAAMSRFTIAARTWRSYALVYFWHHAGLFF